MFYYAVKNNLVNKKKMLSQLCSIVIFTVCVCIIGILSSSYITSNHHLLETIYGAQDLILRDVSRAEQDVVQDDETVRTWGSVRTAAYAKIENLPYDDFVVIGSANAAAQELMHLTLLEGRWAEKPDEIVLEQSLCSKLRLWNGCGETFMFSGQLFSSNESFQADYTVVGICGNYAETRGGTNNLSENRSKLPNAFLAQDAVLPGEALTHLLLAFQPEVNAPLYLQRNPRDADTFFINPSKDTAVASEHGESARYTSLLLLCLLSASGLAGVFSVYANLSVVKNQIAKQIYLLKLVGASRRNLWQFSVIETLLYTVIALPLGLAGSLGLSHLIIRHVIQPYAPHISFFISPAFLFSAAMGCVALLLVLRALPFLHAGGIKPINLIAVKQGEAEQAKNIKLRLHNPLSLWGVKSALLNRGKYAGILLSFALFTAVFSIGFVLERVMVASLSQAVNYDYRLNQRNGAFFSFLEIPVDMRDGLAEQDVQTLAACPDIETCYGLKNLPLLLVREGDESDKKSIAELPLYYFGEQEAFRDDYFADKKTYGYKEKEILYEANLHGVDEPFLRNLSPFVTQGPTYLWETQGENNIIIAEFSEKSPYRMGDTIHFSQHLKLTTDYTDIQTEKLDYQFTVAAVVSVPKEKQAAFEMFASTPFVFVMNNRDMDALGLDLNYNEVYLRLRDSAQYEQIDDLLEGLRNIYPSCEIQSNRQIADAKRLSVTAVRAVSSAIIGFLALFSFANTGLVVASVIQERRRLWGALRAIGLERRHALRYQITELAFLHLASWLLGIMVALACCFFFKGILNHYGFFLSPLLPGLLLLPFNVGLSALICRYPFRRLFQQNIQDLLHFI